MFKEQGTDDDCHTTKIFMVAENSVILDTPPETKNNVLKLLTLFIKA
jgi:hypothetical protein